MHKRTAKFPYHSDLKREGKGEVGVICLGDLTAYFFFFFKSSRKVKYVMKGKMGVERVDDHSGATIGQYL